MRKLLWLAVTVTLMLMAITIQNPIAEEIGAESESDVATQMHEHLARITTIKSFISMGNLDGVREPAMWLADHEEVTGLPENFQPYLGLLRQYARDVNNAPDLKSAAISVSQMAKTCGNCHLANQVKIEFGFDQAPPEWSDTVSHMQRHQWALDRLWDGLIGPSENAWNRGLNMLVDVPLHPDDVTDKDSADADTAVLDRIARRVHDIATQGTIATTPTARSELYGELLDLCGECHTRLDRGPGQ